MTQNSENDNFMKKKTPTECAVYQETEMKNHNLISTRLHNYSEGEEGKVAFYQIDD